VFVHKFSQLSREEIVAMLGVTKELRESRFYRDIEEEIKDGFLAEAVPMLLQGGFSIEDIADRLKITIDQVRQFASVQN
jgi:predicted transposase YdaD